MRGQLDLTAFIEIVDDSCNVVTIVPYSDAVKVASQKSVGTAPTL